jgi:hypothetical protein
MKTKSFAVLALSVLALTLFISSISALTLNTSSLTFNQIGGSQTINVTTFANETLNSIPATITANGGAIFTLTNLNSTTIKATLTSVQNYGGFSTNLQINGTQSYTPSNGTFLPINTNVPLNYVRSFCASGDANDSNLTMSVSIKNDGTGTSYTWNPLDTIEVQIKVSNNGAIDVNNMNFQIGLFNQNNGNIINDMKWISPDQDKVTGTSISADSTETYTFKFQVDPSIITNQNNNNFILMLKAFQQGKENQFCVDYSTSSDLNDNFNGFGSSGSNDYAADISIPTLGISKALVIDQSTLPVISQVSCGQQLTLTPTIYNLGPNDNSYSKNQILVIFSSPQLGIYQNQTLYGDLNSGNNIQVPITFNVPLSADAKTYPAYVNIYYKFNQANGGYFNDYQYISQNFNTLVQVTGGCVYATPDTTGVTAQLISGGKAGSPLVISSTITNNGNRTVSYNFGLEGYSSWATSTGISPLNITLAPGQSQDITLNLNINSNAQGGNQNLYLDTYSNGYLITKQPISVPVTAGFNLSSITGDAISGSNWIVWTFGLLILVLIVAIIIIVARLKRR